MRPNLITAIQKEADNNPVFKDFCYLLTLRQRTRFKITMSRLTQLMEKEGFNHTKKELESVLLFLAKYGIGNITRNRNGRVKSLDNILVRLQSLGKAALKDDSRVVSARPAHKVKYSDISVDESEKMHSKDFIEPTDKVPKQLKTKGGASREKIYPTFLTLIIEGRPVNIAAPTDLKADDIGEFIMKFKQLAKDF